MRTSGAIHSNLKRLARVERFRAGDDDPVLPGKLGLTLDDLVCQPLELDREAATRRERHVPAAGHLGQVQGDVGRQVAVLRRPQPVERL